MPAHDPPSDPFGSSLGEGVRPLRATLKGIASLAAPTSLVTALLYYFGWARTSTQARLLGLEDSLLGFSVEDYLLRSITPMFWPLFVGTLLTLGALVFHGGLTYALAAASEERGGGEAAGGPGPADGDDAPGTGDGVRRLPPAKRRLVGRLCAALVSIGVLSLVLGIAGINTSRPSRTVSLWSPPCLTVAIVLLVYAAYLVRCYLLTPPGRAGARHRADVRYAASILVVVLLLLSVFWTVARYAEVRGTDLAVAVQRQLPLLPDAVVYSARRLHLPEGVTETVLPSPDDSAYRFRHSGLKLLFRSGGRVFLRPSAGPVSHVNVILPEDGDLRFEFARSRRP